MNNLSLKEFIDFYQDQIHSMHIEWYNVHYVFVERLDLYCLSEIERFIEKHDLFDFYDYRASIVAHDLMIRLSIVKLGVLS